ncbi:alpha-amylase family glycosyl hydrolase [Melioribacteraceae bacterium 4301-Me]|uniref:alpha-amylase family glycosyl hydrolase n=1 Tax=Pyranulibacter aquaticus TaxID=3163344 RepID=UPI00359B5272
MQKRIIQISFQIIIAIFLFHLSSCKAVSLFQEQSKVTHPQWSKNAVIYEVNIRQYTPEGTFKAFEKHLPELKQLGVDILWLMPINPIGELNRKGTLGSYYSIKNYKAVNPEFGTLDDLKSLVTKIHSLGMHVIIDWVANHTSWDNVWTKTHPDFYTRDSNGNFVSPVADWSDVIDLNYDNKELWTYMIDAMSYWIKECNIDGFRCDVAAMVPTEFWIEARKELSKIKSDIFMLAEASENYLHQAFDMTYNWQLKDLINKVAKGTKKASDIISYYNQEKKDYNDDDYRMVFTSNHDENSWNGTVYERLDGAAETFAVLCGVVKGMPLIYSGQEAGLNKRLRFFDKDTIDWKPSPMRQIYTDLNNLKKYNKALWNGLAGGEMKFLETGNNDVLAFIREKNNNKVLAIFNLSPTNQTINLSSPLIKGDFSILFEDGKKITFSESEKFQLTPWKYLIYFKL